MLNVPTGDGMAARLGGFGLIGILAMLAILAGNLIVAPLNYWDLERDVARLIFS